jgi:putative FmdB family regulatory protein
MKKIIYEYECLVCGKIQEKWHEMGETNNEPCDKCGATSEHLKKILSPQRTKHSSWSKWSK